MAAAAAGGGGASRAAFKRAVKAGQPTFGLFLDSSSPLIAEQMAYIGFDYVLVGVLRPTVLLQRPAPHWCTPAPLVACFMRTSAARLCALAAPLPHHAALYTTATYLHRPPALACPTLAG